MCCCQKKKKNKIKLALESQIFNVLFALQDSRLLVSFQRLGDHTEYLKNTMNNNKFGPNLAALCFEALDSMLLRSNC